MLHMKERSNNIKAAIAGFMVVLFVISCKNPNDTKESTPATISTDTSAAAANNANGNVATPPVPDTTKAATDNTKMVMGKPNPAKKGGKGKTSIVFNYTVNTDKMEMDKEGVYNRADVMPSFPGGEKALVKFMEDNIQYPQEAIDEGVEGQVQLQFAVDEAGKVYSPTLVSNKIGYGLEDEAMRVVKKMPKWNPGNIKGKNVKTRFTLPISFVINN
jgi:TonB family protein